ncbi:hypothetical protein ACFV3E_05890 [Streptomyces sp. NPDC059718]
MAIQDFAAWVGVLVGIISVLLSISAATKGFTRAVDRERAALSEELLPHSGGASGQIAEEEKDNAKFTKLLVRYYSYGLTQARASFYVSLAASIVGGGVLVVGLCLAIFKADTNGDQYASIVSSIVGLLMAAIGALFHKRADAALRHMETQSAALRQDMKAERDAGQAVQLLGEVDDPALKAHLQAALILKFSAAKLPELGGLLKPAAPVEPGANGAVPLQHSQDLVS